MDNYQIFKSYLFTLHFCSMVFYYQILGCCCDWIAMRLSLSILWSCIEPLSQSNIEATTDKGEDYQLICDNEKYQTIHLTFLGLTEIIQVNKHEKQNSLCGVILKTSLVSNSFVLIRNYNWGLVVKYACYNPSHALWSILF